MAFNVVLDPIHIYCMDKTFFKIYFFVLHRKPYRFGMTHCSEHTHRDGGVGIMFAETVQDDVGADANYTKDTALRAPVDHLNGIGVFLHKLSAASHISTFRILKHL